MTLTSVSDEVDTVAVWSDCRRRPDLFTPVHHVCCNLTFKASLTSGHSRYQHRAAVKVRAYVRPAHSGLFFCLFVFKSNYALVVTECDSGHCQSQLHLVPQAFPIYFSLLCGRLKK